MSYGVYGYDKLWHSKEELEEHLRQCNPTMFEDEKKALNQTGRVSVVGNFGDFRIDVLADEVFNDIGLARDGDDIFDDMMPAVLRLNKFRMTREQIEKAKNQKFLIDGLIPDGHSIVIYGAAGSGKTSVTLKLMEEILIKNPEAQVFYFYLDGQLSMAAHYIDHLVKQGLEKRYGIMTNISAEEALKYAQLVTDEDEEPSNLVFVLDTLKYLNQNILDKKSNAETMHRIKRITNKGATFITLHHTNKDGENFAGTAEIEQDSDALLKLETVDGKQQDMKMSTLVEGGRVRYHFMPTSFEYEKGQPSTVAMLDEDIDVHSIMQEREDKPVIDVIVELLGNQSMSRTELDIQAKEHGDLHDTSERKVKQIIERYTGIYWKLTKEGDRKHIHIFSLIVPSE